MAEFGAGFKVYADATAFEKGMAQAVNSAEKAGKAITKHFEARDIGRTLAAALGINLTSIADKVARLVIGFSKSAEAALEDMVSATGKAADAQERALEKTRARINKEKEDRKKLYEDENDLIQDFLRKESAGRRKAELEQIKFLEELGFAEDLAWVKEQDRIAAAAKLKLEQIEQVKKAEIAATEEAARVEQARIDEKFKSLIDQWTGFIGLITSTGRGDKDLSDRELARKIDTTKKDLTQRQIANPFQPDFFDSPQKLNLSQALAEQSNRARIRQQVAAFGEERAFQMNPGVSERRFQEIVSGMQNDARRQTEALEEMRRLMKTGLPVVNLNPGGG